tara:strand:+ start:58 stop:459 length:402 start_codon:yes stop_codon:yes gene_type:complete
MKNKTVVYMIRDKKTYNFYNPVGSVKLWTSENDYHISNKWKTFDTPYNKIKWMLWSINEYYPEAIKRARREQNQTDVEYYENAIKKESRIVANLEIVEYGVKDVIVEKNVFNVEVKKKKVKKYEYDYESIKNY